MDEEEEEDKEHQFDGQMLISRKKQSSFLKK
jgi:hypothetical protein